MVREWLELEKSRDQEFIVAGLEQIYTLKLGALTLTFKVDRIDKLSDGRVVLIDYKTGIAPTISTWVGDRPQQPQLPLYALAEIQTQGESSGISALTYGQIRYGACAFSGITLDQPFHNESYVGKKLTLLEKLRIDDELKSWESLVKHWSVSFERLAEEYAEGVAIVNPRDEQVCTSCHLVGLCRLHELGQYTSESR